MGLQAILLKIPWNFLIDKLISIMDMESDHNFMANYMIRKLLIPKGYMSSLITEEAFDSCKYNRKTKVVLCIWISGTDSGN